jgi:hypothetical protein
MDATTTPAESTEIRPWYTAFKQSAHAAIRAMELNSQRPEIREILTRDPSSQPNALALWLRDYRTIKIDCGQRIGKTFWLTEIVTENDLVIDVLPGRLPDHVKTVQLKDNFLANPFKGSFVPSTIFIEEASWALTEKNRNLPYEVFGTQPYQRFILLG